MTTGHIDPGVQAAAIAVLSIALLSASCSERCPPEQTEKQLVARVVDSLEKAQLHRLGTYRPEVPAKEFDCVTRDFPIYFTADLGAGIIPITDPEDTLLLSDLAHWLPAPENGIVRGVELYYGMDISQGTPRIVLGLEFVKLRPKSEPFYYEWEPYSPAKFHQIDGQVLSPKAKSAWMARYNVDYMRYARVRRISPHDSPVPLVEGADHESYTFKWEGGLADMIDDNSASHPHALRFHHAASPVTRVGLYEEDWKHIIGVHCVDASNNALLDDQSHGNPYEMRGADLGSPCPPNCTPKKFARIGNYPRQGCI